MKGGNAAPEAAPADRAGARLSPVPPRCVRGAGRAAAPARVDARRKKMGPWDAERRRPRSVLAAVRVVHACAGARDKHGRGGRAEGGGAAACPAVSLDCRAGLQKYF